VVVTRDYRLADAAPSTAVASSQVWTFVPAPVVAVTDTIVAGGETGVGRVRYLLPPKAQGVRVEAVGLVSCLASPGRTGAVIEWRPRAAGFRLSLSYCL
jgi:hypothetical protein